MKNTVDLFQLDLRVQYIYAGKRQCASDWSVDGYVLPFNKLYFVEQGGMIVEMQDTAYHLHRGDMLCIPRGVAHSMRHDKNRHLVLSFCHFTLELPGGINFFDTPDFANGSPVVSYIEKYNEISNRFKILHSHAGVGQHLSISMRVSGECMNLVALYTEKRLSAVQIQAHNGFPEITTYMQNHLSGTSLKVLADMAYLSAEHFVRKFKACYGISPMKYYNNLQIDYAIARIRAGDAFADIAKQIGMEDLAYFAKFFKNHVGVTPTVYRKNCFRKQTMYMEQK